MGDYVPHNEAGRGFVGARTVSDTFESGCIGMTDDLPEAPFIASSLGYADVYHTTRCRSVARVDGGAVDSVSESAIAFHELEHCQFCAGEFDQGSRADRTVVAGHE